MATRGHTLHVMAQKHTGSSRSARKARGVAMLTAGMPVVHVARTLGVSKQTVHRWQNENAAEIQNAAEESAREIEESTRSIAERLQSLNDKAVDSLQELLESSDEKVRLQAARTVLSRAGYPEGKEVDMSVTGVEDKSDEELAEELRRHLQIIEGGKGG